MRIILSIALLFAISLFALFAVRSTQSGATQTEQAPVPMKTMDVPPQDVITLDNVTVSVNAVVYFRVMEPRLAVVEVENYLYATSQLAQTTLRSVLGEAELDELLSARDKLNARLQEILDNHTDQWGIKVSLVEIKAVDLPQEMRRAMSRQAEAEREKRAKIIHAELGSKDREKAEFPVSRRRETVAVSRAEAQ